MSKTTEIRVRPVIRHNVTRFTSETGPDGACGGSSESLGEFAHEGYAEEVAQALKDREAARVYAIVEETVGKVQARVVYAYSKGEATLRKMDIEGETGKSFHIYSRLADQRGPF
jgi:hypothetical protein